MKVDVLSRWHILLPGVVVLSALVFVQRTVRQPQYSPCDFAVYYTGGRAWLEGDNPYDRADAVRLWAGAGGRHDIMPEDLGEMYGLAWIPIIQLPLSHPLFAPLSLMAAKQAVWLWYALCVALTLAQTAALASMGGSRLWHARGLLLLTATLLLAPVHETYGYAQPSGPAISLIILGIYAATGNRDTLAAVLLALATAVKPQLGILFVAYYLVTGRWRLILTFTAICAALAAVAAVPMAIRGTPWLSSWLDNLSIVDARNGMNDITSENPQRFYMLNAQILLRALFTNRLVVETLAILIVVALASLFAWRRVARPRRDELLMLSFVSALTLLPVYHRFYDASLVVVPIAWGIAHLRGRANQAWPVLLVCMAFVIPYSATTRLAEIAGVDPTQHSVWWWAIFVGPFRTWMLLTLTALLIVAVGARRRGDTGDRRACRQHNRTQDNPSRMSQFV